MVFNEIITSQKGGGGIGSFSLMVFVYGERGNEGLLLIRILCKIPSFKLFDLWRFSRWGIRSSCCQREEFTFAIYPRKIDIIYGA